MAASFDFNCPQFVDFQEFENSQDNSATSIAFGDLVSPELKKPTYAKNSCISKKVVDCNKIFKVPASAVHYTHKRRSKSIESLHALKIFTKEPLTKRKRSLSESEISKQKRTCATPLCLKKSKTKKLKTWEELELEKIAELQKQTRMHLRYNENAMRRMNLKPKPSVISSMVSKTAIPSKNCQRGAGRSNLAGTVNMKEKMGTNSKKVCAPTNAKKLFPNDPFPTSKPLKNEAKPAPAFTFKMPGSSRVNDSRTERKMHQSTSVKPQPFYLNPSKHLPLRSMNSLRNVSSSESDVSQSFSNESFSKDLVHRQTSKPRSESVSQELNKENAYDKFKATYLQRATKPRSAVTSQSSNKDNAFERFKAAFAQRHLQNSKPVSVSLYNGANKENRL